MKKAFLIFSLTLILGTLSCGTTPHPSGSENAPVNEATQVPEPGPVSTPDSEGVSGPETQGTVSVPPGLRVIYIKDGNLWSWTEAGGNAQLTNTGDMSTARVSFDGQLLAFMRGREVWTVGMDGMNVRLLATQANEGGALWFSPDGSMLAVSTTDHINVINLETATSVTVTTYPALQSGYYPEVVWSPDALGFKTVIPPQAESGQAEMFFVFTNGTVASLAKFTMSSLSESLPYLSPDGGYLIYAANLDGSQKSLYLMDSSGATRPYGETASHVRAHGWLPDSKHFVFGLGEPQRVFVGGVDSPPISNDARFPPIIYWVDNEHYLSIENDNLILGDFNGAQTLIDSQVSDFDFIP